MSDGAITLPLPEAGASATHRRRIPESAVAALLVTALCALLVLIIALPLGALLIKSFEGPDGGFAGIANFRTYFATPTLVEALVNSLVVATLTVAVVVPWPSAMPTP